MVWGLEIGNLQKTIERLSVQKLDKDLRDRIKTIIGLAIRKYRDEADIERPELAEALGITYEQLRKYETGMNHVNAVTLLLISVLIDQPIEYFFEPARRYIEE